MCVQVSVQGEEITQEPSTPPGIRFELFRTLTRPIAPLEINHTHTITRHEREVQRVDFAITLELLAISVRRRSERW